MIGHPRAGDQRLEVHDRAGVRGPERAAGEAGVLGEAVHRPASDTTHPIDDAVARLHGFAHPSGSSSAAWPSATATSSSANGIRASANAGVFVVETACSRR
jgi:hypothetical protein